MSTSEDAPSGTNTITMIAMIEKINRFSCSVIRKISGNRMTIDTPNIGPTNRPLPPIRTINKKSKEMTNSKRVGSI